MDTQDTQDIERITARVIAIARRDTDKTPAAFDYEIAGQGLGGPLAPIGNAIYQVANENMPEVTPGAYNQLDERDANAASLRAQLQPELDRYAAKCRARKYTGWSNAARDLGARIRYAD